MPPPKFKLHKTSGKARPGPQKISQTNVNTPEAQASTSTDNGSIGLTAEQEQQFQVELYWCIQQLQAALSTDKLTAKQVQEHTKALNTLMNSSAPMAKKRQVMRLSFGDYRTKMLEDERKSKKISIKVGASKPSDKSVFLRKALVNSTGNDFRFNFPSPEEGDNLDEKTSNEQNAVETTSSLIEAPKDILFAKSDNSFKFNFSNSNNGS